MPCGWPKCLKRTPPKIALRSNDLYNMQKAENHHYEEPQEPQQKDNNRVFLRCKLMSKVICKKMYLMKIIKQLEKEKQLFKKNVNLLLHCINDNSVMNHFIFIV